MKRVGILQPGYIPWVGFFEQIYKTEIFVIYDDVQYTKKDWRNRNRIKTKDGIIWLNVPVITKRHFHQKIREARIDYSQNWIKLDTPPESTGFRLTEDQKQLLDRDFHDYTLGELSTLIIFIIAQKK